MVRWYLIAWGWLAVCLAVGGLGAFRSLKTSGVAQTIDFDDVPILRIFDLNYGAIYWSAVALVLLVACVAYPLVQLRRRLAWCLSELLLVVLVVFNNRYSFDQSGEPIVAAPSLGDWLQIPAFALTAGLLVLGIGGSAEGSRSLPPTQTEGGTREHLIRVFMLCFFAVGLRAFWDHGSFFDSDRLGGFDLGLVLREFETSQLNLVLYSTSALFAAICASGGVLCCIGFRWLGQADQSHGNQVEIRRQSILLSLTWVGVALVPWQTRILPEIEAHQAWIFPVQVLGLAFVGLTPLVFVSGLLMKSDFDEIYQGTTQPDHRLPYPRRSEFALWNLLLFPFYPLLRLVRRPNPWVNYFVLIYASAGSIAAASWAVSWAIRWYDFPDWRGMLEVAQFPSFRVFLALLTAFLCYLALRFLGRRNEDRTRHSSLGIVRNMVPFGLLLICLVFSSWPLWGWGRISQNVFARASEYNSQHEFELRFLHWLLDWDRDGYAAVLHGPDSDDFNPDVIPDGVVQPRRVLAPADDFLVHTAEKAGSFPSVVLLFLEGIAPQAISAYGLRHPVDTQGRPLQATPHLDSLASDGAFFSNCLGYYPATWEGWIAVFSGRYLRFGDPHYYDPDFGDRYGRYSNIYKILRLTRISQWCHPNMDPFESLLVPRDLVGDAWKTTDRFSSFVTRDEHGKGIWRGDKRNQRILEFIEHLDPAKRFFISEHMNDSHEPWHRTPLNRARELGFGEGLEVFETDGVLPNGHEDDRYRLYLHLVSRVDGQVGQILDKLKDENLYEQTLIIVVGDHGRQWYQHGHGGHIVHLYRPALAVPLIIKMPGMQRGVRSEAPVLQFDIVPTLMELAGVRRLSREGSIDFPGRSLVPIMMGESGEEILEGYRKRELHLATHFDLQGILSEFRYKLIFDRSAGTYLLFDLEADPEETRNLADKDPALLDTMVARFRNSSRRHSAGLNGLR